MIENTLDQSDCIISKILISQKLFEVEGLLFACNNVSMEAAIWSRSFSRVWSYLSKIANCQYVWKGLLV